MKTRSLLVAVLLLLAGILPAHADAPTVSLVSVPRPGVVLNETSDSGTSSITANGRFVVFESLAGLVPRDENGYKDIYLRDRALGTTSLVSKAPAGAAAGDSFAPAISPNGDTIAFSSVRILSPLDTNPGMDVYVVTHRAGQLGRPQVLTTFPGRVGFESALSVSNIGTVAFSWLPTKEPELVDSGVYVQRQGRPARLVSGSITGEPSDGDGFSPSITPDGRFVAFTSDAGDLVAHDGNRAFDVFVRDLATDRIKLVSRGPQGEPIWNGDATQPSISADGLVVAFRGTVPGWVDSRGAEQVWARNLTAGTTTLVSVAKNGSAPFPRSNAPSISADGRFVAFSSYAENIVPGPTDYMRNTRQIHQADVFIRDLVTGTTRLASVSDPELKGPCGDDDWDDCESAFGPSLSSNGRWVTFWSTAGNMVTDTDEFGVSDVFVAGPFAP